MRDIRPDIQERLSRVEKELQDHEAKGKELQATRDALRSLLAMELNQWSALTQTSLPLNGNGPVTTVPNSGTPLSVILREHLADNKKHHLKDISKAAVERGYPFGQKKPGRVIHFALLGMKSGQLVEKLGDGYWKLAPQH